MKKRPAQTFEVGEVMAHFNLNPGDKVIAIEQEPNKGEGKGDGMYIVGERQLAFLQKIPGSRVWINLFENKETIIPGMITGRVLRIIKAEPTPKEEPKEKAA